MNWNLNRRQFLRAAAGAAAGVTTGVAFAADKTCGAAIIISPADVVASSAAVRWAASELENTLAERGVSVCIYGNAAQAPVAHLQIVAAGIASPGAAVALNAAGAHAEAVPEALVVCNS